MTALQERLTALGFVLTDTGGGCTAYVREDGEITEYITRPSDPVAPELDTDSAALTTSDGHGDPQLDAYRVPMWALLCGSKRVKETGRRFPGVIESAVEAFGAAFEAAGHDEPNP